MKKIAFVLAVAMTLAMLVFLTGCNQKDNDKIDIEVTTAKPTVAITNSPDVNNGDKEYSPRY